MIFDGTRDVLSNKRDFEKVQIEYDNTYGRLFLFFEKNRLIVALDIIINFLFDEVTHCFPKIDYITFNNTKIYNKEDFFI
jgi:hypothetical protein